MKRIIEIDEKIVEQAKAYNDLPYDDYVIAVAKAIANSKPYEEQPQKEIVPVCKVTFDKEQLQEMVDKKVAELFDRNKGEWRDYSDEGYIECPFCGSATTCEDNKDELHYCWNCGAFLH